MKDAANERPGRLAQTSAGTDIAGLRQKIESYEKAIESLESDLRCPMQFSSAFDLVDHFPYKFVSVYFARNEPVETLENQEFEELKLEGLEALRTAALKASNHLYFAAELLSLDPTPVMRSALICFELFDDENVQDLQLKDGGDWPGFLTRKQRTELLEAEEREIVAQGKSILMKMIDAICEKPALEVYAETPDLQNFAELGRQDPIPSESIEAKRSVRANQPKFIYATNHSAANCRELAVEVNRALDDPEDDRSENRIAIEFCKSMEEKDALNLLQRIRIYERRKAKAADTAA
jgi:hypothetical protein